MKAMILAAGVGSRLEPLTCNIPKPMVPVVNRPAMEHIINLLVKNNITKVAANLWYLPDKIQSYFGDGSRYGIEIHYSVEKELMGTAGGVKKLESFFDETFIIVSGDAVTDIDLPGFIDKHRKSGALATIALKEVSDPRQFGVVITDKDGRIKAFQEKPSLDEAMSRLANTGIYIFEPEIFKYIPAQTVFDFGKQLFPELVQRGESFYGYSMKGYWCDIGSLTQYRLAHYDVLKGLVTIDIPGNWHPNAVYVGERTIVAPSARIGSKVVIGNNCHIGDGVEIFGETVIGDNCVIESGASIFGSIVWRNTRIGRGARLVECVVGSECYLKDDSIIGAGVILSDECIVEPGSVIEANSKIWPGKTVL
ncbi:NDP-sugar pyrophosphorylase family protein [Hydrogenispora ethanolica]|uniref:NDP-sugar pyrophosphorylase family protein n=1 Tax=Hydrogenispora ethanolica TaxID=1082276 RepID=A0A4R1RXR7_HYDET|nr:NDP-sugar synthase [Hydrogenispora ethanolica]TCL70772.1 NDP-sugar pyrophosphorylase family protein [Hydrogenispora ethanolica]